MNPFEKKWDCEQKVFHVCDEPAVVSSPNKGDQPLPGKSGQVLVSDPGSPHYRSFGGAKWVDGHIVTETGTGTGKVVLTGVAQKSEPCRICGYSDSRTPLVDPAWDRYFELAFELAFDKLMTDFLDGTDTGKLAEAAGEIADYMLAERSKRVK